MNIIPIIFCTIGGIGIVFLLMYVPIVLERRILKLRKELEKCRKELRGYRIA